MDLWKAIWMVVLFIGVMIFAYIAFFVIVKGYVEVRELLKEMLDTPV